MLSDAIAILRIDRLEAFIDMAKLAVEDLKKMK